MTGGAIRLCAAAAYAAAFSLASLTAHAADVERRLSLSKAEATIIANRFFADEIAIEGAVAERRQQGDDWVFPVKFGYANFVARDPILVNRFSGKASWAGLAEHNARLGRTKAVTK